MVEGDDGTGNRGSEQALNNDDMLSSGDEDVSERTNDDKCNHN